MHKIYIDFETRSRAKLRDVGARKYAMHESTDVLCMSYAVDDGPLNTWVRGDEFPLDLTDSIIVAHNYEFELFIWNYVCTPKYGWPAVTHRDFLCTMAKAKYYGLPPSLELASQTLGTENKKDIAAQSAMKMLSTPRKHGFVEPEDNPTVFNLLKMYCEKDDATTRDIDKKLPELPAKELELMYITHEMNSRGVTIDTKLVDRAIAISQYVTNKICEKLTTLTDGKITSPTQTGRISAFTGVPTLSKDSIDFYIEQQTDPIKRQVLLCRKLCSSSSVAKFTKIRNRLIDGTLFDVNNYFGAHTGRFSSLGVQVHNLPSSCATFEEVEDVLTLSDEKIVDKYKHKINPLLSSCIRRTFMSETGFVVSDFKNIETRVLLWAAGCENELKVLAEGGDLYVAMASTIYNKPERDVTPSERKLGKVCILACGYQMSAEKFVKSCSSFGVLIPDALAVQAVQAYRTKFKNVTLLWREIEEVFKEVFVLVQRGTKIASKPLKYAKGCSIKCENEDRSTVCIRLPSGRYMYYRNVTINGDGKLEVGGQLTYGGKLTENIVQAIARDLLVEALLKLDDISDDVESHPDKHSVSTFRPLFSVHDEVVVETDEAYKNVVHKIMEESPPWASDLPLAAETEFMMRYGK